MMQVIFRTVISSLVPKVVDNLFSSKREKNTFPKGRKKRDTTKLTQCMYDYAMTKYTYWMDSGKRYYSEGVPCNTQDEITVLLNSDLKLDKTRTFYSNIFKGKINYNELPKGENI